ncbi:ABC transporter substrate-binding protein [Alphaproteobacteria bacterium]|nr:ABC transporter substrate-binding protein [Alphaproteobacteria bacterium]
MYIKNISIKISLLTIIFFNSIVFANAKDTIKIGTLLPYSGVYTVLGEEITNAMILAFEEVDNSINGKTIELIKGDTEVKPNIALQKARKLVSSDKVDILVGPVSSSVALAIRNLVVQSKTPLIIPNAGANVLTGEKCSKFITRISFSNYQINAPMGTWLAESGVKSAFLLAPDYAAGKEMMSAFRTKFEEAGGEILGEEYTPFRKTKDFGPYLARVKNSGADAVYVFYAGGEAINFIKQAHSFGLGDVMKLTGAGWTTSPLFLPAQKNAAIGFIGSLNYVPSIDTEENKNFIKAYIDRFDRSPSEFAVQGYDSARVIIKAIESLSGNIADKDKLAEAINAISITGPRGPLTIDPETNNVIQNIYIFEVVSSKNGPELKVLDTIEAVKAPGPGCKL